MSTVILGVLHLLDRDGTAVCSSPFGLLTGSLARCTCAACINIWFEARDLRAGRPLVSDADAEEVRH